MIDLYRTGTYLRCPGGNVETAPAQKAAGVEWALLNIGSDPCVRRDPAVWDHQRAHYRAHGMPHGPWMHVRSMEDLTFLLGVAETWKADLIGPNVEDVVGDHLSLREIGGYLLDFWVNPYGKPVHMATLPWVQNEQGWQHVAFATLALELFPLEGQGQLYLDQWQRCVDHAFAEGAKKVTLLFSTTSPRSVYPNVAHCLYTADNVTDWSKWKDSVPQVIPQPPEVPTVPLTEKQFPYTGPFFGPSSPDGPTRNTSSIKGIKRGMIRGGFLSQELGTETDDFGLALEEALKRFQRKEGISPVTGQYGRGSWTHMRYLRVPAEMPNAGQYAMDSLALKYVREDLLKLCYPHPENAQSSVCQGLHATAGLTGNWAIDFCAPGGTKVVAVERAKVVKLSGRDPALGAIQDIGIFGWSIHYEHASGRRWFSTHYGTRTVRLGQIVEVGDVVGTVGSWPDNPGRSHTHLGVTSPLGTADAKKWITAVSTAPRVTV